MDLERRVNDDIERIPLITSDAVKRVMNTDLAIETIEQAYQDYGRERRVLSDPPALLLREETAQAAFKVKGARIKTFGVTGFRVIADRTVNDKEETIDYCWIAESETGRLIGLVDKSWLHRLRTALTGVVAAKWLANPRSRVAAIIGAGKIADELPVPLSKVFNLSEIRIAARRKESAELFARRHQHVSNLKAFANVRDAVNGADIVICITASSEPVLLAEYLQPGMFICGLGGGPEISSDVLTRVDRFIVDELKYAAMIGSIRGWIKGGMSYESIKARVDADIGEIALAKQATNQGENEITLAIIQGMACCDLALAKLVLSRCNLMP